LEFEDDGGDALKVHLEAKGGTDEYFVREDGANGKKLQAFGPFTASEPNKQACIIDYSGPPKS
jgi:hypothetical protein